MEDQHIPLDPRVAFIRLQYLDSNDDPDGLPVYYTRDEYLQGRYVIHTFVPCVMHALDAFHMVLPHVVLFTACMIFHNCNELYD